MNINKKYEKKKEQVQKLKAELEQNRKEILRSEKLISEVEEIKAQYEAELDILKKQRKEYEIVLSQLRILRKAFKTEKGGDLEDDHNRF